MILTRRRALIGIVAAPFIVRSTSLMRITRPLYVKPALTKTTYLIKSILRSHEEGVSIVGVSATGAGVILWGTGNGYKVGDYIEVFS